ncbi:putative tyrosyl-DNA phosphodiesterase [Phyllosticta citribraziliensis]|uniref:Tyrosyl-DNA phosphodiesterase n=1 Tax=Phyllosticta citribraziliensis TaxID=989973 RepID=A0ABR1M2Z9_9PEZI
MSSNPAHPGAASPQDAPAPKRRRVEPEGPESAASEARRLRRGIASLHRSVSPPARRQAASPPATEAEAPQRIDTTSTSPANDGKPAETAQTVPSPFQLTRIRDLPASANVDAVGIENVLRDPLITETWVFNYMFDVDWLMSCLDPDTRTLTQVKVVHGNWKREDPQRMRMEVWAQQYPNLEVITAYMPEPFGTHHSKMLIHFRADDTAQVVIHTANMIPQDWANMTQAVWRSPLLPLLPDSSTSLSNSAESQQRYPIGSGPRFGSDLNAYLSAYGARLRPLANRIARHDFRSVRAALVASVPGRVKLNECDAARRTAWGWVGLQQVLAARPESHSAKATGAAREEDNQGKGMVVAQVSSIASLGATDKWLQHFHGVLSTPAASSSPSSSANSSSPAARPADADKPPLRIVFPTPAEIRRSLDGYASGGSIHTKTQANATQRKQADYLRPYICRWDGAASPGQQQQTSRQTSGWGDAQRGLAAPHVKTYVRFSRRVDERANTDDVVGVEWALLTSANLSTQAWGALATQPNSAGSGKKKTTNSGEGDGGSDVRICSWEVGVCVWSGLFAAAAAAPGENDNNSNESGAAIMTPVFSADRPLAVQHASSLHDQDQEQTNETKAKGKGKAKEKERGKHQPKGPVNVLVGLRLPYSLPLARYAAGDDMWCASAAYGEVDRWGRVWGGF